MFRYSIVTSFGLNPLLNCLNQTIQPQMVKLKGMFIYIKIYHSVTSSKILYLLFGRIHRTNRLSIFDDILTTYLTSFIAP